MHRRTLAPIVTVLAFGFASPAWAGFYCGTNLIDQGTTVQDLLAHCGEPKRRVNELLWIYDLGPNELLKYVHIEDGQVSWIQEKSSEDVE